MGGLRDFDFSKINPWVYFLIFSASNVLLAYFPLSYITKGWIFFGGILVPLISSLGQKTPTPSNGLKLEFFKTKAVSGILLAVLGSLAAFLRFYKLTQFHLWPTGDEGLHGFLAIPLSQKWDWQFFYTVGEHPPLLIWFLSFFFRFFDSPFFDLWFFPAIFSILTVPMGYIAARLFFSESFSFVFGCLLAFSFWPMVFGRFCHQGIFIPFWELLSLWLLGCFLKTSNSHEKKRWIVLLGLWVGLGSLTFTSWAVVVLLITLTVFWICTQPVRKNIHYFGLFSAGLFFALIPFLAAAWREGYGHHLIDSSAASSWFSREHQLVTYLSYVTCLFWGNLQPGASYGPSWGGMLNPLLSSCFFLGFSQIFRRRGDGPAKWLILAFGLCLLPGFLAADYVEFNRVIQVMPFLLLFCVIGLQSLIQAFAGNKKMLLALMLLVSFGLDLNHLLKSASAGSLFKVDFKREIADENFNAYQVLNKAYGLYGPGLLFTDFMLLSHNHTLSVATYHFNAALNPRFDPEKAVWAGLMVNSHYRTFLLKRFPDSEWYDIASPQTGDGGMVVGLIPIHAGNQGVFNRWVKVHHYFHSLSLQAENILNNKRSYQEALEHLPEGYPLVEGDPFLESCFGEWLAQYHYGASGNENIMALQRAISKGYPCANLYYKIGNFLFLNHQFEEAKTAYLMAAGSKPNYTDATDALRQLSNYLKIKK